MPSSKRARERMKAKVDLAVANGDSALANEITANVMVGSTMLIVFALMLICLILNEIGVFTADKHMMRIAVLIATLVELPITVLNYIFVGTKKWLRIPLMSDLIIVCAILAASLGHNVVLVVVFPVVISVRYFDKKFTLNAAIFGALAFTVATLFCGHYGIVNLNMVKLPVGSSVLIGEGQNLRSAITENWTNADYWSYTKSLLVNEFLPRCVTYLALCFDCILIADRGKNMIILESENTKKTSRIETELDLATRIQTSMLPCILPAFPGHENIDLRAVYHPAKEVGGDFYDYFIIDKTHVGIVIADVSGKGVGAALFMTISKTVLKNQLQLGIRPEEALNNANRQLCENNDAGLFVTCWAGVYDTESGILTFVNAGHNPPVILRKGQTAQFIHQRRGFVLAGMEDFPYKEEELQLSVGDEMFFYTDGVTEATNVDDKLYGDARLLKCLDECRDNCVEEQIRILKENIDCFVGKREQFDDITVMGMRIT